MTDPGRAIDVLLIEDDPGDELITREAFEHNKLNNTLHVVHDGEEGLDYLYEPERDEIIEGLLPRYIRTKVYFALADSQTAEHAARMAAMENATNNCGEMITHLTLVYNKTRQQSITNDMMDIVGGAEALQEA